MQNHLSRTFLASEHAPVLKKHGFDSYDAFWSYEGEWFEKPNKKRGGWSGVNFLSLHDGTAAHGYYLKRQSHYQRRTLAKPIVGEPTYAREFEMLQYLANHSIGIPELVYFAQTETTSILVTAALTGYQAADQWLLQAEQADKKPALAAIARVIKNMHQAGVEHRALYLKHIFIKPDAGQFQTAIIDFEKARLVRFPRLRGLNDLKRCLNRTKVLEASDKAYLVAQYFNTDKPSWLHKIAFNWLTNKK